MKIGIPKALLYFKYGAVWKVFFEKLGLEVVESISTNRQILNQGLVVAENELCLPVKAFFGHVLKLEKAKVDLIFVPRIASVEKDGYTCPKLMGLPDMVLGITKVKIISPLLDVKEGHGWQSFFMEAGEQIGFDEKEVEVACKEALKFLQRKEPSIISDAPQKSDIKIGVVGHHYILQDKYLSMNLVERLQKKGVEVLTSDMVSAIDIERALKHLPKSLFWNYQKEIFGAAQLWCEKQAVDAIIHIQGFPCGPDSVVGEFISGEAKRRAIPLVLLTVDEHSGEAGIITRIEALIDSIELRKKSGKEKKRPAVNVTELPKIARKDMIVSFPRMGDDLHLVLGYLCDRLGVRHISPPPTTEKTIRLGAKHAPETMCLPLKIIIGNFIEILEAGANVLIIAGGCGPCRFGYYGVLAAEILRKLGYKFEFVILEPPGSKGLQTFADFFRFFSPGKISQFVLPFTKPAVQKVARLTGKPWVELLGLAPHDHTLWKIVKETFFKKQAFDLLEREVLKTRCYEEVKGDTTKARKKAIKIIDQAKSINEIKEATKKAIQVVKNVKKVERDVLKVVLVGEFYMLQEPFVNFDIEKWLGERGVYLKKGAYASDFIDPSKENLVSGTSYNDLKDIAKPYLSYWIGGEGVPTIAHTVQAAREGFDGVIHLMPFTCMPETVAMQIMPEVSKKENISCKSFVIDEQTGKAGFVTRLEAFIDLMWSRREGGKTNVSRN